MTRISEKRDVRDALVNYLIGIGWTYLPPAETLLARGGDEAQPFLSGVLCEQLVAFLVAARQSAANLLLPRGNVIFFCNNGAEPQVSFKLAEDDEECVARRAYVGALKPIFSRNRATNVSMSMS